ncbi:MAG TPA: hypothetical protein VJT83_05420 [Chitinophagaceae bacterium]|nr:hypothetical protein [Chitinophagaceae bacterium]
MKLRILLPLIVLLSVAVSTVNGQTIRQKSRNENARIAQGRKSGEITRLERKRIARDQREVRRDVRIARKDDGRINRVERREIRHDQRKASRHIYRAKHNRRKAV